MQIEIKYFRLVHDDVIVTIGDSWFFSESFKLQNLVNRELLSIKDDDGFWSLEKNLIDLALKTNNLDAYVPPVLSPTARALDIFTYRDKLKEAIKSGTCFSKEATIYYLSQGGELQ